MADQVLYVLAVEGALLEIADHPIKCRCGELRQAGAKGWRFCTCADGEPRWQCPECRKTDADPIPR